MVQRFNNGGPGSNTFWRVSQPSTLSVDVHDTDIIRQVRKEVMQMDVIYQTPQDEHLISPWLHTTHWHQHTDLFQDKSVLRELVRIPDHEDDDLDAPGIKKAVQKYFNMALELLPLTDELVLKKLNSPDPAKK